MAPGWVLGNYNTLTATQIILLQNVSSSSINYTVELGKEIDALTPKGTYSNAMVFRMGLICHF